MEHIDLKKLLTAFGSAQEGAEVRQRFGDFPIEIRHEVSSTNDILKESARRGGGPSALIAERQSAGKGRQGRSFFSESGLYLSAILPPLGDSAPFITHLAAVSVADAIRSLTGEPAEIKWVNDVFLSGKKVCGILCESVVTEKGRAYIAGIGVNIEEPKGGFPPEIRETAGIVLADRSELAGEILKRLLHQIAFFNADELRKRYRDLCFLTGRTVGVQQGDQKKEARVLGLSDDLALLVRYADGSDEALRFGEVHLLLN